MPNTLKVNVTFQLEVPIRTDSAGRRLSITDQVSPYISDYFADLQTEMKVLKHHKVNTRKKNEMKNCWLKKRALKKAINQMMDIYFRGRIFSSAQEISDIYEKEKYGILQSVMQKYGSIKIHVDIKVINDEIGKYYVEKMSIRSFS